MAALQRAPGAAPIESPPNPMVYSPAPPRRGSGFNLVAGLLLAILLLLAAVAGAFFVLFASLTGWGGRTVGDAGQQAATAVRTATDALGRAGQEARDRLDPSHPPRDALAYDAEIEDFVKLGVGQSLSMSRTRSVTLSAITSRDGADHPELARFVVVHSELRQPNETKVLGLTIRTDSEPRDDYLYQGEGFRLGGQVYKVNWVSPERQQVGLIQLRNPDQVSVPLKFTYD